MISAIHHVALLTGDLARSRAFYEDVLGLHPSSSRPPMGFDGVWYDIAPKQQIHLMLLPNPEQGLQRPAPPQGMRRDCTQGGQSITQHGGHDRHVALGVSDLAHLIVRLDEAGIAYTQSLSGRRALFCRDPDNNALEFIEFY